MKRVVIQDETSWPNPASDEYHYLEWRLRHAPESISNGDMMSAASVMAAYSTLILHPAFTLKKVQKKVSGIRKAITS